MSENSVMVPGRRGGTDIKCIRCGARVNMLPEGGAPMEQVLSLAQGFEKRHAGCKGPIIEEPTPKTPDEWLYGDDTGISSAQIWRVMTRLTPERYKDYPAGTPPRDGADFGRCHRLLQAFPAWRARLQEVADAYPQWEALVEHWTELETLYLAALNEKGKNRPASERLYARIQLLAWGRA